MLDENELQYMTVGDLATRCGQEADWYYNSSERAREMALLQNRLRKQSYRVNCPTSMELRDYHLGCLPAPQALAVSNHVRECLLCQRVVQVLESFLTDMAPKTSLSRAAKILIERLMGEVPEQDQHLSSTPAFVRLPGRGEEPSTYYADPIQIIFEVQEDLEQVRLKILLGFLTGLETNEFTIQVGQWGKPKIGNFNIPHLSPGQRKLILSVPNTEIHLLSLLV